MFFYTKKQGKLLFLSKNLDANDLTKFYFFSNIGIDEGPRVKSMKDLPRR